MSDEEMAFIEAALAATRSSLFQHNVRSIRTITFLSKKRFASKNRFVESDIEDLSDLKSTQKKNTLTIRKKNVLNKSLFQRLREKLDCLSLLRYWVSLFLFFLGCFGSVGFIVKLVSFVGLLELGMFV